MPCEETLPLPEEELPWLLCCLMVRASFFGGPPPPVSTSSWSLLKLRARCTLLTSWPGWLMAFCSSELNSLSWKVLIFGDKTSAEKEEPI